MQRNEKKKNNNREETRRLWLYASYVDLFKPGRRKES